jgi:hypothetical protein
MAFLGGFARDFRAEALAFLGEHRVGPATSFCLGPFAFPAMSVLDPWLKAMPRVADCGTGILPVGRPAVLA